ncbi:10002_t:CDS:1, partial [Dentiscutata heterogama]
QWLNVKEYVKYDELANDSKKGNLLKEGFDKLLSMNLNEFEREEKS